MKYSMAMICLLMLGIGAHAQEKKSKKQVEFYFGLNLNNSKTEGSNREFQQVNKDLGFNQAQLGFTYGIFIGKNKNAFGFTSNNSSKNKTENNYSYGYQLDQLQILYRRDILEKEKFLWQLGTGIGFEHLQINCDTLINPVNLINRNSARMEKRFITIPIQTRFVYMYKQGRRSKTYLAFRAEYGIGVYEKDWVQNKMNTKRSFYQPNYALLSLDWGFRF